MSLINTGMSGLTASQFALQTTGNNISNSGTAGYNRQIVSYAQMGSQFNGTGFLGQGVLVTDVQRVYDQFLSNQVNQAQTQYSQLNTYYQQISQINNAMGSSTTGLSSTLTNFFTNLQTIVSSPNNSATRATVIASAQTLTSMFQSLSGSLAQLRTNTDGQIGQTVEQINGYAKQIASLNQAILEAKGSAGGVSPNDLLDQRDQAVAQLNTLIQTNVVKNDDGSYNVFVGNGQSLVSNNSSYSLTTVPSAANPTQVSVAYINAGGAKITMSEASLTGGSLGGLLSFRSGALTQSQNSLGQIALSLAQTFNDQSKLGLDLNGQLGGNFFSVPTPTIVGNANNSATAAIGVTISDATKVTASDYTLGFDGTTYTLKRATDGTTWTGTSLPLTDPATGNPPDGLNITLTSAMAAGDSFTIEPTRNAAQNIGVAITDPAKIALAAPVLASAATTNTGTGKIDQGSVDKNYLANVLAGPTTLTYQAAVAPATGNVLSFSPNALPVAVTVNGTTTTYPAGTAVPYDPTQGDAKIVVGGVTVTLSGTPTVGDTFTIAPNTAGAVTDNRNGLKLSALQTDTKQVGGTASYAGAYANLVSYVGSATSQYKSTSTAQQTLLQQAQTAQQSDSGVNLDEEGANLIKFQQLYQANSKVIQTAGTLFDTILQIVR
ncbi:flagellar hook-associated protein FlgK [Pandoraea terrae]|uniref:Flagellar hook-associated protein 1 n=1 Tax=Pandoraea terrae TaxID=1537710 RepID=A0A5E4W6T8_9BURK|nr:flagellar hook-associated protein FlgK [Pandoraea terrae]VVE19579.1 flagellar hook-associated protein FlgK [Pandoraea terrae]